MSSFTEKFSQHLATLVVTLEELFITGDFNIHVDNLNNVGTQKFPNYLDEFGTKQHVVDTSHDKGQTVNGRTVRHITNINSVLIFS